MLVAQKKSQELINNGEKMYKTNKMELCFVKSSNKLGEGKKEKLNFSFFDGNFITADWIREK